MAGSALVALGSRIEVPMIPVPMTLQTYALVVVGALAGARLGAAALLLYLAEGAVGLPVFAGGAAGWHHFAGPTAGYLFAYPGAAALVGWLSAPRRPGGRPSWVRALLAANAGHALLFLGGVPWLALTLGWAKAVAVGLTPFLLSGLLQTVLAAGTVRALWPWARRQAR